MKTVTKLLATLALVSSSLFAAETKLADGLYAKFETSKGEIITKLFYKKTPLTVCNFVSLAEGTKENNVRKGKPYYDGLNFHRVIPNFMIQGGCPEGSGRGNPGYSFADEIDSTLKHNKPGILSMANSGPATNGSQFFITHKDTSWLDGKHTVFGETVSGMDVVNKIAKGDKIIKVTIVRQGADAKAFKTGEKAFKTLEKTAVARVVEKEKAKNAATLKKIKELYPKAKVDKNGIYYIIDKAGTGESPKNGQTAKVHYSLKLLGGNRTIDSSYDRNQPFTFQVGKGRVIKAWDRTLLEMKVGEKRTMIAPPTMAYGSRAMGPIPANSYLVFEMTLISFE